MDNKKYDKQTMIGVISMLIVISGIFGFVYEFIFYYINSGMKEFYYRGGNFLPWINIYAIGSLFIYFLTYNDKGNPLKVFIKSTIICGVIEYVAGFIMYDIFGFRCWDYNTEILNFGNINGYICLRSVLFFGVSSLLLIYIIVPFIFYLVNHMTKRSFLILSISLCFVFLFDEVYNLVIARLLSLPRASDIYKSIGIKYMSFKL